MRGKQRLAVVLSFACGFCACWLYRDSRTGGSTPADPVFDATEIERISVDRPGESVTTFDVAQANDDKQFLVNRGPVGAGAWKVTLYAKDHRLSVYATPSMTGPSVGKEGRQPAPPPPPK